MDIEIGNLREKRRVKPSFCNFGRQFMTKKYIKKRKYYLLSSIIDQLGNIRIDDVFYVSLVGVSIIYGALIYGVGEKIESEMSNIKPVIYNQHTEFEEEIKTMAKGYPIERMARYISRKDRKTAAFLIGVAKKESNWGLYTPKLNGQECYNYWGYRGVSERMTPGGYTCFSSPGEAVRVISKRIDNLVRESSLDTPEKMVVWKCGWSCAGHSPEAVKKWISDVAYYYEKVGI